MLMFKLVTSFVLFGFDGTMGRNGSDQPYLSMHKRPVSLTDMQLVLYKSGFAGVCLSYFSRIGFDEKGPYEG